MKKEMLELLLIILKVSSTLISYFLKLVTIWRQSGFIFQQKIDVDKQIVLILGVAPLPIIKVVK